MNKYERIFYEASKKDSSARWFDLAIRPLAADLSEYLGLPVELSGPFGLRAECILTFNKAGDKGQRKMLVVTPDLNCVYAERYVPAPYHARTPKAVELVLYYDTGKTLNLFDSNTMGDYNGLNNEVARLPDTIPEIAKVLRTY